MFAFYPASSWIDENFQLYAVIQPVWRYCLGLTWEFTIMWNDWDINTSVAYEGISAIKVC